MTRLSVGVAVLIAATLAVGCGSSSKSSSSSSTTPRPAATTKSPSSKPIGPGASTAKSSSGRTIISGGVAPGASAAAACKANTGPNSHLPAQVKAVYARICSQLAHHNPAGAAATAHSACVAAIQASPEPAAVKQTALAHCPKP